MRSLSLSLEILWTFPQQHSSQPFQFLMNLIPRPVQVGTAIGVGLITALAGATEIDLVVKGNITILDIGPMTKEVILGLVSR